LSFEPIGIVPWSNSFCWDVFHLPGMFSNCLGCFAIAWDVFRLLGMFYTCLGHSPIPLGILFYVSMTSHISLGDFTLLVDFYIVGSCFVKKFVNCMLYIRCIVLNYFHYFGNPNSQGTWTFHPSI
jgi:hypothetical protein